MRRIKLLSALFISSIILSACGNPFDELADEINSWLSSDNANTSEESTKPETAADSESSDDTDIDTTND